MAFLHAVATDEVDPEAELRFDDILLADKVMRGVQETCIGNSADVSGANWGLHATTKAWNTAARGAGGSLRAVP